MPSDYAQNQPLTTVKEEEVDMSPSPQPAAAQPVMPTQFAPHIHAYKGPHYSDLKLDEVTSVHDLAPEPEDGSVTFQAIRRVERLERQAAFSPLERSAVPLETLLARGGVRESPHPVQDRVVRALQSRELTRGAAVINAKYQLEIHRQRAQDLTIQKRSLQTRLRTARQEAVDLKVELDLATGLLLGRPLPDPPLPGEEMIEEDPAEMQGVPFIPPIPPTLAGSTIAPPPRLLGPEGRLSPSTPSDSPPYHPPSRRRRRAPRQPISAAGRKSLREAIRRIIFMSMPQMTPRNVDPLMNSYSSVDGLRTDYIGHLVAKYYYEELQAAFFRVSAYMAEDISYAAPTRGGFAALIEERRGF
ncbi:hypothetical protein DFJ58DRAFT_738178 [Suillus subalutaceus]|nr:uncharacterized protein DFJ58DRAFT_738178 [Suillus subalutaceus]KAG1827743.1 hypothetical protein DFJ58DRAFT_738178 [Suillus subalutaceus]